MQAQIDRLSPVLVAVKVEVPWAEVGTHLEQAYRALQKSARVRGFRPGKVPRHVIKNLMAEALHKQTTGPLVEDQLAKVIKDNQLDALAVAELDAPLVNEGAVYNFSAKIEVRPEIASVDTSMLKIERKLDPVADAQVDAELERLRQAHAELRPPEPARPAQDTDTVTFDADVVISGELRAELGASNTRAELGVHQVIEVLEQALRGMSVGEEKTVDTELPANHPQEDLRGKPATFKLRLKHIQEKILPALDDEFARDLEHESLVAMRANVRERLEADSSRKAQALVRDSIIEKLIDGNPVPVPPSMLSQQQRQMIQEILRLQEMLGGQLPLEGFWDGLPERAERKVRAGLLLGAIAKQQSISVSDDEIEAQIAALAGETGKHIAKVRAEHQGDRRDGLRVQLLERKLFEYLESQATITDVAPETTASAESPAQPAR